jgi:glycosyltransferase involved in cell wall biosynthesis
MPVFNGAGFLEETLRCVARQTFDDFEVCMVDDGSTDGSAAIMQRFASADPRFRAIVRPRNAGLVAARNAGLALARGTFVALLDQDDLWTDDALEFRVGLADGYPSADVIATDFAWFSDAPPDEPHVGRASLGKRARTVFRESFATGQPTLLDEPFEAVATLHFAWIGATLIRRIALLAIGNFDTSFVGPEDTLVWLRLARRGKFLFSPRITAFYRQHAASIVAQYKMPKEFHYLKVLNRLAGDGLSPTEMKVVRSLMADCHHVSANHVRKGLLPAREAVGHAWQAVRRAPGNGQYWKGLAGSLFEAMRRRRVQ